MSLVPLPYRLVFLGLAIAGAVLAFNAYRAGVYAEGVQAERSAWQAKDLQRQIDDRDAAILQMQAVLDEEHSRAKDAAARLAQTEREKADAKRSHDRTVAQLRSGELSVRDRFVCAGAETGAAAGDAAEAHSGFGAEDAAAALAIAADGDDAIRQLNQCVDQLWADRRPAVLGADR